MATTQCARGRGCAEGEVGNGSRKAALPSALCWCSARTMRAPTAATRKLLGGLARPPAAAAGRAAHLFRREFRRAPNWCARRSDDSDTCRRAASGASAASPSALPHYRREASGYTARQPGRDARVPAASASRRPSAGQRFRASRAACVSAAAAASNIAQRSPTARLCLHAR